MILTKTCCLRLLLPLLLFGTLWAVVSYRQSSPTYILAQYPKSPAFNRAVKSHQTEADAPIPAVPMQGSNAKILFYSTWFSDGRPNVAMQCVIDEQGRMFSYRDVYDWAIQNSHYAQFKPSQLAALKKALPNLPSRKGTPTLNNLLILSFRDGKTWTTRIYDKTNLPAAVIKIYKTIGASRIEGAPI